MNSALATRVTERLAAMLAGPRHDRRSFLSKVAVVGSALAVNPLDFLLKPQSAYATVCGPSNECHQGWSAFCCTINDGANTCPPGSYEAGWWKVSSSAFCRGEARYVVDCNRLPDATCSCHCAAGDCDRRRVCCNNFRYGQCNTHIVGVTEVVCRIVICTPPWEWNEACSGTARSDERTRQHSSSCLPGEWPSLIAIAYQDLGLTGSALGAPIAEEEAGPRGGAWRAYERGAITYAEAYGVQVVPGFAGERYVQLGGPHSPLGYATGATTFEGGEIIGGWEVYGAIYPVFTHHRDWIGDPITGVTEDRGRARSHFASGWSLVHDPALGEVRLLPSDVVLPDEPGTWPPTAQVPRWAGADRVATAARVALEAFPDGSPVVVVAPADDFPHALVGASLGGPVLLVARDLAAEVREALDALDPETVYVVGNEQAVSLQVEAALREHTDAEVHRIAGADEYETAAEVSRVAYPEPAEELYVASGVNFPDALAGAGLAAPLLLTLPDRLPHPIREEVLRHDPARVVVLGGQAAVADSVAAELEELISGPVVRWAGATRYETAAAVSRARAVTADTVVVTTGTAFPDAIAAGPPARRLDAPVLLVQQDDIPQATEDELRRLEPRMIVVIGGHAAVSDRVVLRLSGFPAEGAETGDAPPQPTLLPSLPVRLTPDG